MEGVGPVLNHPRQKCYSTKNKPEHRVVYAMKSLDVVIFGAGIGGLATALALATDSHRVKVLDGVPEFSEVDKPLSKLTYILAANIDGLGTYRSARELGTLLTHRDSASRGVSILIRYRNRWPRESCSWTGRTRICSISRTKTWLRSMAYHTTSPLPRRLCDSYALGYAKERSDPKF